VTVYCYPIFFKYLIFQVDRGIILRIDFSDYEVQSTENKTEIAGEISLQFDEYCAGNRKQFSLPYQLDVSYYQTKVLEQISRIPYGRTVSYAEIARKTTNAKAARAVGSACNKNPLPIIIPCHRVLGSTGLLTGYAGGLELKKSLLDLERNNSSDL
jgi:methylated-DNA-[protein]-cysteine S-methyltransferase